MNITNRFILVMLFIFIVFSMNNTYQAIKPSYTHATGAAHYDYVRLALDVQCSPPSILSFFPLVNPNITEEGSQLFNVSYDAIENVTVSWYWNGSLVQQELKGYPGTSNYTFTANYSSAGMHEVLLVVSNDCELIDSVTIQWILNVTNINRPPYFHSTIEDISWYQGTSYTMESLDNYVYDFDFLMGDDILSYSYTLVTQPSHIGASINPITHEVFFNPDSVTFTGSEIIYFRVTDSEGEYNYSNNVTLTVMEIPPSSAGGGGGGGGGGDGGSVRPVHCESEWYCGAWSACDPITLKRTRECIDLAGCTTPVNKPSEMDPCFYIPTCYDGIRNQGELAVDCGGPCPSCWTCYDGIKNQDEDGIDCGGPCHNCSTCYDGRQNCQRLDTSKVLCEIGVDCGGPCPNSDCCKNNFWDHELGEGGIDCGGTCDPCEVFSPPETRLLLYASITALLLSSFFAITIFRHKKRKKRESKKRIRLGKAGHDGIIKIEQELGHIEKGFNSFSSSKILKTLSDSLIEIIYYKFKIKPPYTKEELVGRLNRIKERSTEKKLIAFTYCKIYNMKFSGEEIFKEELLQFVKAIRTVIRLDVLKILAKEKNELIDPNLKNLYELYIKKFYHEICGDLKKAREIAKAIQESKYLPKKERKVLNHALEKIDEVSEVRKNQAMEEIDEITSNKIIPEADELKHKSKPKEKLRYDLEKEFNDLLRDVERNIRRRRINEANETYQELIGLYLEIKKSPLPNAKKIMYYQKSREIYERMKKILRGGVL